MKKQPKTKQFLKYYDLCLLTIQQFYKFEKTKQNKQTKKKHKLCPKKRTKTKF